jgi:hypothetical protein
MSEPSSQEDTNLEDESSDYFFEENIEDPYSLEDDDVEEELKEVEREEELVKSTVKEEEKINTSSSSPEDDFIQSLSHFSAVLYERAKSNDRSLLAMVLEGKTSQERERILEVAYHAGVEGDDPLFAVLLATGQLELLLSKKPNELNLVFDSWQQRWSEELQYADAMFEQQSSKLRHFIDRAEKTLEIQSRAALDVQSRTISDSVNHLVKKAAYEKVAHDLEALIRAGSIILAAIGIGVVVGLAFPKFNSGNTLAALAARKLTLEEVKALDWGLSETGRFGRNNPEFMRWARSNEGKYARQLMQWNQTLLSDVGWGERLCERDTKELGITLRVDGREAKSGFCVLWTKPPGQRKLLR